MALIKRNVPLENDDSYSKKLQEIKALEEQILKCKEEYYNIGGQGSSKPSLTDAQYDNLEKRLRELDPDNRVLTLVGAPEKSTFPKVKHETVMLSLNKEYTIEGIEKFRDKRPLKASFKIDGNSLKLHYKEGILVLAATRGEGDVGVDVTANAKTISDIPLILPEPLTGEVVGEVYMKRSVFQGHVARIKKDIEFLKAKLDDLPSNPRNYAAGSLKQEDPQVTYQRNLSFMAYDVSNKSIAIASKKEVFLSLDTLGFVTPFNKDVLDESVQEIIKIFETEKEKIDYDVDGIVFEFDDIEYQKSLGATGHHPRGKIAFKWESEEGVSSLIDYECKVGRTGKLSFTGIIEPIELSGAQIRRFTLHNYEHIEKFNVCIGDDIRITRSGEVIPKFLKVEKHNGGQRIIVDKCPVCDSLVVRESCNLVCKNPDCDGQYFKKIVRFIEVVGIEEVGKKNLQKIYDKGLIATPADLYRLKKEDLLTLEKFGDRSSEIVINSIVSKKKIPLNKFIAALGIKGVGETVGDKLAEKYETIEQVRSLNLSDLNFGEITDQQIINGIKDNSDLIDDLLTVVSIEKVEKILSNKLDFSSFCLTGKVELEFEGKKYTVRKEIESLIKNKGGQVKSKVSQDLNYLVCDEPSNSSKFQDAAKFSVKVISGRELAALFI